MMSAWQLACPAYQDIYAQVHWSYLQSILDGHQSNIYHPPQKNQMLRAVGCGISPLLLFSFKIFFFFWFNFHRNENTPEAKIALKLERLLGSNTLPSTTVHKEKNIAKQNFNMIGCSQLCHYRFINKLVHMYFRIVNLLNIMEMYFNPHHLA